MFGKNEDKARIEADCYGYCIYMANQKVEEDKFLDASIYLENAARSLRELDKLKVSETDEEVVLFGTILTGRNHHDRD